MEENQVQEYSGQFSKEFIARDSLLTTKWKESKNFRSLYNIVVLSFIYFFIIQIYFSSFNNDVFGFLNSINIRDLFYGFIIWLALNVCCWLALFGFKLWIICKKRLNFTWLNKLWLLIYIVFLVGHVVAISYYQFQLNLSSLISVILSFFIVANFMKIHSFVRTNVDHNLNAIEPPAVPTLGAYLYFLYAPTFFYRDKYPRNKIFRWKLCILWMLETICLFTTFFIALDWSSQFLQDFGSKEIFIGHVILKISLNSVPGICFKLMGFVGILHSYMNSLAEILFFADRNFYSDWWNAKNGTEFLKLSNHLVQDFVYKFIYGDLKNCLHNQILRSILTTMISGLIHDFVMAMSFRFFIPFFTILMTTNKIFLIICKKEFFGSTTSVL
jgi:hypothetical protein